MLEFIPESILRSTEKLTVYLENEKIGLKF
jgi:flavorubredoxin